MNKIQVWLKSTVRGNVHKDLHTFMTTLVPNVIVVDSVTKVTGISKVAVVTNVTTDFLVIIFTKL